MKKSSPYIFIAVLAVMFAVYVCGNTGINLPQITLPAVNSPTQAPPAQGRPAATRGSQPPVRVYFTNPNPPDNTANGIDQVVTPVLDAARSSIDLTSFDFNLPSVTQALVDAQTRGVQVRVVLDLVNGVHTLDASRSPTGEEYDALKVLKAAGIQVVDGGRENGLMHDKMIIVDGATLYMGSWNMSYNDTFRNNNNLLEITDPQVIANYQAKFNELFVDRNFGTQAKVGALNPVLSINGMKVENYFSPTDHVMSRLVSLVNQARKSIKFMVYTYTDKDIAQAMIDRANAGLTVQGVIESRGATNGAMPQLYCARLPVKVDGNRYTMHHKVIIIDDSIVVTGSFNLTKSADDANDDNVLILFDPTIAQKYLSEFNTIYAAGKEPNTADFTCP